jgi:hypothetical protein
MKTRKIFCLLIAIIVSIQGFVSAQKIYLSQSGSDINSGTVDEPLFTLTAARDKARELRKTMKINEPLEIIAAGGEYFMMQPLFLTTDQKLFSGAGHPFQDLKK